MSNTSHQSFGENAVAVVGISCRLPGGVHGPAQFWDLLAEGRDAVREVPADRHALILTCVVEAAAEVMGADSPDTVPLGTPLLDLGFTSLMAVDLRNKVTRATGVDLPPTVVYDHPTFEAIASHVHALMSTD